MIYKKFNIVTANHDLTTASNSIEPLIEHLKATLSLCGYEVTVQHDKFNLDSINILIEHFLDGGAASATLRALRGAGHKIGIVATELMLQNTIPYAQYGIGCEPKVLEMRMTGFEQAIKQADFVWALLQRTAAEYQQKVKVCHHFPYGSIGAVDQGQMQAPKDIDLLFFGKATPHRIAVIKSLQQKGLQVVAVGQGFTGSTPMWKIFIDSLIDRSKIALNLTLHAHTAADSVDPRFASCARIVHLLSRGCLVVSEEIPQDNPYSKYMLSSSIDSLPDVCSQYLQNSLWRAQAQELSQAFTQEMNVRRINTQVIKDTIDALC